MDIYIFPCLFSWVLECFHSAWTWKLSMNMVCTPKKADLGHKQRKINPNFFFCMGCFTPKFLLERKISPRIFLWFVLSLNFHCQPDASAFVGILFKFNFPDFQLQTNHGVNVWNRQNHEHGKHWGFGEMMEWKVVLSGSTGEAAVPEMPPSPGRECLWACGFPFPTWEVFPAHLHCLLKVFSSSKGHPVDFRPRECGVGDVWVNTAL